MRLLLGLLFAVGLVAQQYIPTPNPGDPLKIGGGAVGAASPVQTSLGNVSGSTSFTTVANANVAYSATLTGDTTATLSATPTAGTYISFAITQDSTGGHAFTWPSGFNTTPTVYPGANCTTTALFLWNGAAAVYQTSGSYCGAYIPETAAPTITPASGFQTCWNDSTTHGFRCKDSSGNFYGTPVGIFTNGVNGHEFNWSDAGQTLCIGASAAGGTTCAALVGALVAGGQNGINFQTNAPNFTTAPFITSNADGNLYIGVAAGGKFTLRKANVNVGAVANTSPATATNPSAQAQLMELALGANMLNLAGQTFLIKGAGLFTTAAAQTPTLNFVIKLCTVSGCGSGTVQTIFNVTSSASTASATNNNWNIDLMMTTVAAGASATFETHGPLAIDLGALTTTADTIFVDTNTAVSGAIDSTASLFLDFFVTMSSSNASNSVTQRQGVITPQL